MPPFLSIALYILGVLGIFQTTFQTTGLWSLVWGFVGWVFGSIGMLYQIYSILESGETRPWFGPWVEAGLGLGLILSSQLFFPETLTTQALAGLGVILVWDSASVLGAKSLKQL